MKNINENKITRVSHYSNLSFWNLVLIWSVYYILQKIISVFLSYFVISSMLNHSRIILFSLSSFLSFYITVKYLWPSLIFSDAEISSVNTESEEKGNRVKSWSKGLAVFVWAMPIIGFFPMVAIYFVKAMSPNRNIDLMTALVSCFFPVVGIFVAFLQYNKTNSFGPRSIHMIPTFISFVELFLIIIISIG